VRRPVAVVVAVAAGVACTLPTTPPPADSPLSAPINSCADHPCASYTAQPGLTPGCNGGLCLVVAQIPHIVVAVSLSEDSYFAPGQTYLIDYGDLFKTPATDKCSQTGTPTEPRSCAHLPAQGEVLGDYLALPQDAVTLQWNLGNAGKTALPVHVTYRRLWTAPNAPAAAGADSLGLPMLPLPSYVTVDTSINRIPGPNGGASINFFAEVQPGTYERVVAPDPPFDAAFPADVSIVTVAPGQIDDSDALAEDVTTGADGNPTIPTFDLSRVEGFTGGWTAYLRDAKTLRRLSPVAPLKGTKTTVVLPTNHHPSDHNAITGTELVVAPPAGKPIPTMHIATQAGTLQRAEPYPSLPALVAVSGSVLATDGTTPVEADLTFDATAIYTLGTSAPNPSNFEYTASTSARIDPTTGAASWSMSLPPGQYTVTARPLAAGQGITVVQSFQVDPEGDMVGGPDFTLAPQEPVTGRVVLTDKRPLSGATVEVIPTACAFGQGDACLPRFAQTTTSTDGTFGLLLDQGSYTLRIAPAGGTGFGWYVQTLLVQASPVDLSKLALDVPAGGFIVLHDPYDNAIVGAVVRVYQVPTKGAALELGRAITDSTGAYEMFLTPRTQ
jgi:hypothetical protein